MNRFLAFDFGAESGRAHVGTLLGDKVSIEEIHRFPNEPVEVCGTLHWDVLSLYSNLLKGMKEYVARFGDTVDGVGIDTWGNDFGLLDSDGKLLQNPVHYRDRRVEGMVELMRQEIAPEDLFQHTGMPLSPVNTSVQLFALRSHPSPLLKHADTLLMMPDLFNYFLTGRKIGERTDASSSQLYDPCRRRWSEEVFSRLDLPVNIMPPLTDPATVVGELCTSVQRSVGIKRGIVLAPCTHDTASAVAAAPGLNQDWAFISSGTWSVVGALSSEVLTSAGAFRAGVCNELTLGNFFLCHNIMGLWLLQQLRRAWQRHGATYSNDSLIQLAKKVSVHGPLINPNDPSFYAPEDILAAIRAFCVRTQQTPPQQPGEIARCILESLALCYRRQLDDVAHLLQRRFRVLHIVGGGARNSLLCQLTADATGLPVVAGPVEATVMGNLLAQAMARGYLTSCDQVRQVACASSDLVGYEPTGSNVWPDRYAKYLQVVNASQQVRANEQNADGGCTKENSWLGAWA
jgi:rhamnulokinase